MDKITLGHGSGGKMTHGLIRDIFFKYLDNDILREADDAADLDIVTPGSSFTTDSFVVKPVFFPGGDIGKLSVCGTVNDLSASGSVPAYMSCGFIIEEGFPIKDLEAIVRSMGECALAAGVKIVTGDTKVVARGEADGIFINTAGIGSLDGRHSLGIAEIEEGDRILINGTIGDHGLAILSKREGFSFDTDIISDCAPLNHMVSDLLEAVNGIRFMRDPTRGGLATTLNEITGQREDLGITIYEENIPVKDAVRAGTELLGMDPLYMANEGKMIIVVDEDSSEKALETLKKNEYGRGSAEIGVFTGDMPGRVKMRTRYGADRIVDMHTAGQLPRIC